MNECQLNFLEGCLEPNFGGESCRKCENNFKPSSRFGSKTICEKVEIDNCNTYIFGLC